MTIVLGIDPSLTATGVAVFADRKLYVTTVGSEQWDERCASWEVAGRRRRIVTTVLQHVAASARGDAVVVIEDRIKPTAEAARGNTTLELAALRGVFEDELWVRRIPVATVHPSTLKKYATGRGDASKLDMVRHARDILGTRCPVANDNEADAFFLMLMGVHRYGLVGDGGGLFSRVHVPSLDKATWPVWTPAGRG